MRRAAIVCRTASGLSGATLMIHEHARRLRAGGWQVDVYAAALDAAFLRSIGARQHLLPGFRWTGPYKRKLFAALADFQVSRGRYDVVHGQGDNFASDVVSLHNCVCAAHEEAFGAPADQTKGVAAIHARILRERRFQWLIANSELMRRDVITRFGVPENLVTVIYPGHDPDRFNALDRARLRGPARVKLGFGEDDLVFGLITSGDFVKRGVDIFIAALGLAARRGVAVKALVVGKESHLDRYARQAASEGVDVRFLPPSARVERFYHALDVYVHPARFEEFGLSVLEAMACGLPVIASRRVGAVELLPLDAPGVMPAPQPEALASQIESFADDPDLRRRACELSLAASRGRTWDRFSSETTALYERLPAYPKKK